MEKITRRSSEQGQSMIGFVVAVIFLCIILSCIGSCVQSAVDGAKEKKMLAEFSREIQNIHFEVLGYNYSELGSYVTVQVTNGDSHPHNIYLDGDMVVGKSWRVLGSDHDSYDEEDIRSHNVVPIQPNSSVVVDIKFEVFWDERNYADPIQVCMRMPAIDDISVGAVSIWKLNNSRDCKEHRFENS